MSFKKGYDIYDHKDLDFFPYLVFQIHKNAKAPVDYTCQFNSHNTTQEYGQIQKVSGLE